MHRHAFLIMAHNNWYTLEKLIQIIDAPWNDIYLHIDCKAKDFNKGRILGLPKYASIQLTKRHDVTWGNESQVKAEMTLFKAAYRHRPYWYYHFLSGSDLPLKSIREIYDFFDKGQINFVQVVPADKYLWRLRTYINVFRQTWIPVRIRKELNVFAEIVQYKFHTDRLRWLNRHYPKIGKGHNWCDLTEPAVKALIAAEHDILRFTRFTHCSDEMYKQIVLLNQPEDIIGSITDTDIRYIDWSEQGNHPRTLTMNDCNSLICPRAGEFLFARKFDETVDRQIIDMIYNNVMEAKNGGQ